MAHQFEILNQGKIIVYSNFDDIPESFENLIRFAPEIPPEPHTEEQHHEIDQWNKRLQILMRRETK